MFSFIHVLFLNLSLLLIFFFASYAMFYNTLSVVLWLIQRCLLSIHTMFYNVLSDVLL